MNTFVFVGLLAVAVYCLLMKTTFKIESGIFMYQRPATIYKALSDMDTVQQFHPFMKSHKLLRSEMSPEGILSEYHTIVEQIPIYGTYTIQITFDVKMEFVKPKEVLIFTYSVLYGTVVGQLTWRVELRNGHHGPGAYFSEEMQITCPWVSSYFTKKQASESHYEMLRGIRNSLERLQEDS